MSNNIQPTEIFSVLRSTVYFKYTIIIFLSIIILNSCEEEQKRKFFWVRIQISKELGYKDITVNGKKENLELEKEYLSDGNNDTGAGLSEDHFTDYIFLLKFPIDTNIKDLYNYIIKIKSNSEIIWTGTIFNENEFSSCGFYQMKDEPYLSEIKETGLSFSIENIFKPNRYYLSESNDSLCNTYHKNDKPQKVMITVNIANNSFNDNLIDKINELEVDNGIENNDIWNNYRDLIERSALRDLYYYSENLDGYGKNSGYWNLMVDRDKLKDYKLNFLSKNGIKTTINLNEVQFCATGEKTYEDLIDDFGILTYAFTLKDGIPRLDFRGALDNNNRFVNCSKESDTTSGIAFSPDKLLNDRYGEIKITKFNNEEYDYSFSDNKQSISYNNLATNSTEYKELGLSRWHLIIYSESILDSFGISIPWHLIKEGEELNINSNMINEQIENEKSAWNYIFKPIFYNEEHSVEFDRGNPIINYGNYQEITYKFNKVPKFYGDFLDMEFHFTAKEGEKILLDYAGTIKSQYFGEDIFHCFNKDNLWICPKPGFEENFPWMEE